MFSVNVSAVATSASKPFNSGADYNSSSQATGYYGPCWPRGSEVYSYTSCKLSSSAGKYIENI